MPGTAPRTGRLMVRRLSLGRKTLATVLRHWRRLYLAAPAQVCSWHTCTVDGSAAFSAVFIGVNGTCRGRWPLRLRYRRRSRLRQTDVAQGDPGAVLAPTRARYDQHVREIVRKTRRVRPPTVRVRWNGGRRAMLSNGLRGPKVRRTAARHRASLF
jgi:hypothetical protein